MWLTSKFKPQKSEPAPKNQINLNNLDRSDLNYPDLSELNESDLSNRFHWPVESQGISGFMNGSFKYYPSYLEENQLLNRNFIKEKLIEHSNGGTCDDKFPR